MNFEYIIFYILWNILYFVFMNVLYFYVYFWTVTIFLYIYYIFFNNDYIIRSMLKGQYWNAIIVITLIFDGLL